MVNKYKKIVLLNGLEAIQDYEFRLIKSLLAKDLKLTRKMQDDYDRIRIADLMEEKFQNDAGLRKLIAVCRDIPALADLAETLEKQRLKVKRKSKGERKSTVKKGQQDETTTAPSTSPTKPDSEPESKEEIPSLKKNKIKKSEDPEGMQLPRVQRKSLAPSATSKQKTERCPHGHPPTPFSSPPIKKPIFLQEMEATNNKTNNMKVQEPQGQCQLQGLSEMGIKPSQYIFHTSQTPPTAPSVRTLILHATPLSLTSPREIQAPRLSLTSCSRVQIPFLSPTKPSGRIQTPHFSTTSSKEIQSPLLPPTSSNSLQTPQTPPTAPPSSLQTPQIPPTAPPSSLQTPQIPPTAPPSSLQTPQIPPTAPPSSLQTPQIPPTAPPSSLQTPQIPPTAPPSSLQTPQIPPKASSGITHNPHLSPSSTRDIQVPHLSLTSCSRIQTPHMSATKPTGRIQTPHFSPTSSREIQSPASPNRVQTPQMPPTEPSNVIQNPQNRRLKNIPKEASKECGYQKGPKEVMVLKATESFIYELKCGKKMFHATVVTESEFFHVKVFDISLKDKFIPRKVIAISDYIGRNGFLEIYSASSVSDVSANRKMEIPYRLLTNANATPKIEYLCSQCTVKYVNGVYTVYKKNVREDCTYYEIQDNTGKMEVVVYGRLTYINCEEGDKLKLFCFELAFNADKWQLRSVFHSYIKDPTTTPNTPDLQDPCLTNRIPPPGPPADHVLTLSCSSPFSNTFQSQSSHLG
ncbi:Gamma-interferon-inducible protein 16 [Sciurus carolinensis]|uniref:Gamma-interferon-inducible protein 16 n=1 Tax=Sciurus carolinensis TaxID=30640 RepID=A0AA41NHG0_SCICA|nr:Gamma-interferon-inducible protein 16 [Sciurus carolinensis]